MQYQVCARGKAFYTGTHDECQQWLVDYGAGYSQFDILPFSKSREIGDISETY